MQNEYVVKCIHHRKRSEEHLHQEMENKLFHQNLDELMPCVMDKSKCKKGASAFEEFALFNFSSWDISDLPILK